MKFALIEKQCSLFPLLVLCNALSVNQSVFRAWRAGDAPDRKRHTEALVLFTSDRGSQYAVMLAKPV